MKKLSFIVPVYNVEKYISQCLDSLLSQNIPLDDYEIIVVNDGSLDNSVNIIKNYQEKYKNIILVNKENGGLSSARNCGIEHSLGQYIWMVDSDDTIQENCLNELLSYAFNKDLDFISFPINDVFPSKTILSNFRYKPRNIIINQFEYLDRFNVELSAWSFIVKREHLNNPKIRFVEGITQEDMDFVIRLLENCNHISSYQEKGALYNYRIGREGSITTVMNKKKYIKTLDSFFITIQFLQNKYSENIDKNDYGFYAQRYINNFKCYALSYLLYFPLSYNIRKRYFEKYKQINAYDIGETRFLSWKVKLMSYIYQMPILYKFALYVISLFRNK